MTIMMIIVILIPTTSPNTSHNHNHDDSHRLPDGLGTNEVVAEVPRFPLVNELSWGNVGKVLQHMANHGII